MKLYNLSKIILIIIFFFLAGLGTCYPENGLPVSIRVLLHSGAVPVKISSPAPFKFIINGKQMKADSAKDYLVQIKNDALIINDPDGKELVKSCSPASVISTAGEPLKLNGKRYRGKLQILAGNGKFLILNTLPLEDYLLGVLPLEFNVKEAEALKAQAVVARTYALGKILKSSKKDYDITSDPSNQAYGGFDAETLLCSNAVKETSGQILTFNGKLADSVCYHSTCGGHTEDNEKVFGTKPISYLRGVDCRESCKDSRFYTWKITWSRESLEKIINDSLGSQKKIGKLRSIEILEQGSSGRVSKLLVEGENGKIVISGDEIRKFLKFPNDKGRLQNLYSTLFKISLTIDKGEIIQIEADGGGWGHGVGMCQFGALGMAKKGMDYRQILLYYFNGIKIDDMAQFVK
ncbi:MAG: SpoIID/LytB domain-containing protein [Firmicutes bacterium]|nr:SpoIID/LytB domain-containing protein [Bacillota bacterium]